MRFAALTLVLAAALATASAGMARPQAGHAVLPSEEVAQPAPEAATAVAVGGDTTLTVTEVCPNGGDVDPADPCYDPKDDPASSAQKDPCIVQLFFDGTESYSTGCTGPDDPSRVLLEAMRCVGGPNDGYTENTVRATFESAWGTAHSCSSVETP